MYSQEPFRYFRNSLGIIALIITLVSSLIFQATAAGSAAPLPKNTVGYKKYHVHYDLNADGTYTELGEIIISVLTEQGVRFSKRMPFGIPNVPNDKTKRDIEILKAYTLKKSGEHIDAIVVHQEESSQTDNNNGLAIPHVAFQGVKVGDALVVSYQAVQREPELANGIIINEIFPTYMEYDDAIISVNAPSSLHLRIETVGVGKGESTEANHIQQLVWKYQNKEPESYQAIQPQPSLSFNSIHISSYKDRAAEMDAVRTILPPPPIPASQRIKTKMDGELPLADKAMNEGVPKSYHRPVSDWQSTEKSIYQGLLSNGQFDVLVVPFQVQGYALDRPTRSLMTAELATAIRKTQKLRVADPYLVARALGDGDRRLDQSEVYSFADKIGAKQIIWGYVGHDRNYHMTLSIQLQKRNDRGLLFARTPSLRKNFEHVTFSDEQPPIEVYQSLLPEIVTAIGGDVSALKSHNSKNHIDLAEFPPSPLAMADEKHGAARDALYFQLLAYLTPEASERAKERFAEKSMLAIYDMSPDSSDYRALKARALMLLGLRPAALHILGEPKTPVEKELAAALNGNQPDVELYSNKINPGIERFIAALDANYLAWSYQQVDKNKSIDRAASFKLPGEIWPILAVRSFTDLDDWSQYENYNFKKLLDHDFPIKDYTLEDMIRGMASLGGGDNLQTVLDLSVINHVQKLLEIDAEKWCCQSTPNQPSRLDYLNLVEAIGQDNLMRRARFLTEVQGVPERTLDFLNRIETVYKDNPQFSLARATAQIKRADAVNGAEKVGILKSAYANLFDAMYFEQGQTRISADAFDLIGDTGLQDYGYFENLYASDYPFRAYYPPWEHGGFPQYVTPNAEAALRNSTSNLRALNSLNWFFISGRFSQESKLDALFKSVEGRFAGSPLVYQLRANNSLIKGDVQSAEKYLREAIKVQPGVWHAYIDLGRLLIQQGQLNRAAKLFMKYPGFRIDSEDNPVGISNYAYEAGSEFYWMGEFALAKSFYNIASRRGTSSYADLTSQVRLKLLNGDFRGALIGSLDRARHYNSSYGYRDYLGLLHAIGAHKEAWNAFHILARRFDDPHIWETALVGHRMEEKSEAEVAAWAKQEVAHNVGKVSNRAANYLLRAGVTDRSPSKDLAKSLADIALPVWKKNRPNHWVIQRSPDGIEHIVGPRMTALRKNKKVSTGENIGPERTRVKSSLVYFAEAYRAIRTGDFSSARSLLREASTLYDMSKASAYLLPYYAFAAAKTGDVSDVENYIADFNFSEKSFDYFLAKAVISGVVGKAQESVQFLKSALYRRPFTEDRPLQTEYQYGEICYWLYETTKNPIYKKMALDWAKKNQKFQPWFAWAYAMEAVLSNDKGDRKRAIAMATYLDPQSAMLEKISKKERAIAVKEFKDMNPFLKLDDASSPASI